MTFSKENECTMSDSNNSLLYQIVPLKVNYIDIIEILKEFDSKALVIDSTEVKTDESFIKKYSIGYKFSSFKFLVKSEGNGKKYFYLEEAILFDKPFLKSPKINVGMKDKDFFKYIEKPYSNCSFFEILGEGHITKIYFKDGLIKSITILSVL